MSNYSNIDYFYAENKEFLLESDEYRLCKSIPRNVEEYVSKFAAYYKVHKKDGEECSVDKQTMTRQILGKEEWKDTDNTAKRIMKEIKFLTEDDETYTFTSTFDDYVASGEDFEGFLIEKLQNIHSMDEMTMYYNSIISALREGYLYGNIMDFPDSKEKFKKAVTNESDRENFKQRVFDVYGFAGRYRNVKDDYTPNANYRILTTLRTLEFIEQVTSDFENIRTYRLTGKAIEFLKKLNENLGSISEEKFDELIIKENEFEEKIRRLAEKYGVEGTHIVTHSARLPQVQDAFRDRLIQKYCQKCMLCGMTHKDMLIASHIRRAADEDIYGKADYNNGLLLCANHDKLFDRYLISFNCLDGKIMLSKTLSVNEKSICQLDENYCLPDELLTDERVDYLMDHNSEFYKKESERE